MNAVSSRTPSGSPYGGPRCGAALQRPAPDDSALRVCCVGSVVEEFEPFAVDRSQMEGLVNGQDRLVDGHRVQVVAGGVPALGECGVVVTETEDPLRPLPHLTVGEFVQLLLEGFDTRDIAVGIGQEIGDGGLQAGADDVAVRIDEARQQSRALQVPPLCIRPLPLCLRPRLATDEDDQPVLDSHRLGHGILIRHCHDGTARKDDVGISARRSRRDLLRHRVPPVLLPMVGGLSLVDQTARPRGWSWSA